MVESTSAESSDINALFENLHKIGLIKRSDDIIKDALSEMVIKYGRFSKETARKILNSRISGKLSDTIAELRSE